MGARFRSAGLLLAALLLAGCGGILRSVPPQGLKGTRTILVFADHFHSGIVLPSAAVGPELDGRPARELEGRPWTALHFGEEVWMTDLSTGFWHAASLAVSPGPGMLEVDRLPSRDLTPLGVDAARLRWWSFPVDEAGWSGLLAAFEGRWVDRGRPQAPAPVAFARYLPSSRKWSLSNNCHDFTLDLLRGAGLDLRPRAIYDAGRLRKDLDRAQEELDAAGVVVIGPCLPPAVR